MLAVRDAYNRWAPHYDQETAVTVIEHEMVTRLAVATNGRRVLDAGCGTGRRMRSMEAAFAVGVDLTFNMLAHAATPLPVAAADVRALPFADDLFDVIFCRLVVGHVEQLASAYGELSRVCRPDGTLVVTDFHAAAANAGHQRTFRDANGQRQVIEHYVHMPVDHVSALEATGFTVDRCEHGTVGPTIRHLYVAAGRATQYDTDVGLPLVLALVARQTRRV